MCDITELSIGPNRSGLCVTTFGGLLTRFGVGGVLSARNDRYLVREAFAVVTRGRFSVPLWSNDRQRSA